MSLTVAYKGIGKGGCVNIVDKLALRDITSARVAGKTGNDDIKVLSDRLKQ
jgi:hypothetical protein